MEMLSPLEQQVFVQCRYNGASPVTRFAALMVAKDDFSARRPVWWGRGAGSCMQRARPLWGVLERGGEGDENEHLPCRGERVSCWQSVCQR